MDKAFIKLHQSSIIGATNHTHQIAKATTETAKAPMIIHPPPAAPANKKDNIMKFAQHMSDQSSSNRDKLTKLRGELHSPSTPSKEAKTPKPGL